MGDGAHAKEVLIVLIDMREDEAALPHILILREELKWHVIFARIFHDFDCAAFCAIGFNDVRHVNRAITIMGVVPPLWGDLEGFLATVLYQNPLKISGQANPA